MNETYSEYCTDGMSPWTGPKPVQQRMIRSGRWKLIYYHEHQTFELFNLAVDPREQSNVANAHPDIVAQIRAIMAELTQLRRQTLPRGEDA